MIWNIPPLSLIYISSHWLEPEVENSIQISPKANTNPHLTHHHPLPFESLTTIFILHWKSIKLHYFLIARTSYRSIVTTNLIQSGSHSHSIPSYRQIHFDNFETKSFSTRLIPGYVIKSITFSSFPFMAVGVRRYFTIAIIVARSFCRPHHRHRRNAQHLPGNPL